MASVITHAFSSLILGKALLPQRMPRLFWGGIVIGAILPDIDVLTFSWGYAYGHVLGHRGFTHSILFAFLFGFLVLLPLGREIPKFSKKWWRIYLCSSIIFSTHGLLDAMTNGGLGVAFFFPFGNTRYFLPWRPLIVAPLGVEAFFSPWGQAVLLSEIKWIWFSSVALLILMQVFRQHRSIGKYSKIKF